MRRAMICIAAMLALAGGATEVARASTSTTTTSTTTTSTTTSNPTPTSAEITRAITHAERSRYLWATINICRPHVRQGGLVGVRGEMGALGFRSTLTMSVQLRQYDSKRRSYVAVRGSTATRTVSLGPLESGVHQDGAEFHYASDTGLLDATITFTWTRNGKRLGKVTRTTTGGHHNAAFAQPKGHSASSCRL
ncbi:MAG TPA: hypothetical protein VMF07_13555 [Solirubrobacteraceae bacterium]|nr:hypothetical protein [Solirubrobacteraceae bacterium]